MLNCCSLFFFCRYLHKGILYISRHLLHVYAIWAFSISIFFSYFLLDYAFASSYEECTVPSVDM